MSKKAEQGLRFEDRLEALEKLTQQMEEGNLGLEALLKLYEQGISLSEQLKKELAAAENTLSEIKDGKLKPVDSE